MITIYDPTTGEKLYELLGSIEPSEIEGLAYYEGLFDHMTHYVDVQTGGLVEKPARPSEYHQWNVDTKVWVDPRTIDDRRAVKWAEIKRARGRAEFGGFTVSGLVYDSDQISQSRIQGACQLAQLDPAFSVEWTLADNSTVTLDQTAMIAVGIALGQHINNQHMKARDLRAKIDAATTIAEVGQITW